MSAQTSIVPTNIAFTVNVNAEDRAAVRESLLVAFYALRDEIEPNTFWGHGFLVSIQDVKVQP